MHKKIRTVFLSLILPIIFIVLQSCEKEPNDLGFNYIPTDDTLGTIVLDSQTDSMQITSDNYRKYINTYLSEFNLIGKYQNYESKFFMKFTGDFGSYDSCSVLSADLYLSYNNYYFQDSLGHLSFNVYPLNDTITFSTATADNLPSTIIGTEILGTYSGVPVDSARIGIPFDTSIVRKWIWLASNSGYSFKNYGIALVPNSSSTSIKGFLPGIYVADNLKPTIRAIVEKNSDIDTIYIRNSENVSFNTVPESIMMNERFIIHSGISFRNVLKFDLSKLPFQVTINEAYLELTLDSSSSYIKNSNETRIAFSMITDSAEKKSDGSYYYTARTDTNKNIFYIRFQPIFQKWNLGINPNYGILVNYIYEYNGLDKYVFYSPDALDASKRPRLRIRYTPRN
ncbi:MAG: hypothetical protein JW917_06665 [Ignavibacteria bacterium]|nr:hypothetical protein [Ignavibacteria bacterium]